MKVFLEKVLEHNFKLPPEKGKLYLIIGFVLLIFIIITSYQFEDNAIYSVNSFDFNINMDELFDPE